MPQQTAKRFQRELCALVVLATFSTGVFWMTDLDFQVAGRFYQPGGQGGAWPYQHWWLWRLFYDYAFVFAVGVGLLALAVLIAGSAHQACRPFRRKALYLLLVMVVGPGLVVNLIVKDHWGRPRPLHVTQFGGEYQYVPPLEIGDTPDKSFVCGHCSVGYALFGLYFLSQNYKIAYFLLALVAAAGMGMTRMTAGGHFLSDVLWSGYLVFLVAFAIYYGWYVRVLPAQR